MIHFKDNKNKSPLNTRWAQMTKQEQIIERKKMEIQAKVEAQKQAVALAAHAKLANPTATSDDSSNNIFSNDGSFMSNFKALLEKQKQEKEEKEQVEKQKNEEQTTTVENQEESPLQPRQEEGYDRDYYSEERRSSRDRVPRDKHRRWNDRGRNRGHSPTTPVIEERKKPDNQNPGSIPSLMQIPIQPPDDVSDSEEQWGQRENSNQDSDQDKNNFINRGPMGPMPPGSMPPGSMPPGMMGPGMMGPGPGPMGPGPMGPGPMMGPGGPNMHPMPPGGMPPFMGGPPNFPMPPNFMGPNGPGGPMPPNMCGPNGPMPPFFPPFPNPGMMGPNGPPNSMGGPNGPPNSMMGPNGPQNSMMGPNGPQNSMMGPNGPPNPMMGPNGPQNPMMGPNGPPNSMMGPNGPHNPMMGPNGPQNPMMGPNGPHNPMLGPNGPQNPMMGPNGPQNPMMSQPPNSMMGPNGPPHSMMGPNGPPNSMNNATMPFMGPRPPFGPNGPNFGNGNPPNMPFMPPMPPMPPNSMKLHSIPEPQPLDAVSIPAPEPMKLNNIPPPMPLPLNHIPKPKDLEPGNIPAPRSSQVLSSDSLPPSVTSAATEVAINGDHWENVLKAIHTQDQNMWFLHNPNSGEYKAFRELVNRLRSEKKKQEVKDEDVYEPEFALEDDDSSDVKPAFKEENSNSNASSNFNWNPYSTKREHASSQSDDDTDSRNKRRNRKKKSRWGDDPPVADIKPPGVLAPFPGSFMPGGPKLAKIEEDGFKLATVNRSNQALMQYAMTNYGTTTLSPEDWKKCEDNFKLNLLYQDMLKKRQEVERLAAAGKHKYEYDSDEDVAEGTWEHKLRSREMNATEKWADELTKQAAGKHHIGDFLPPEELKKFMEKYSAVKSGKEPDLSDYKEFKLKEDNLGFKMLQKLGWNEGQGLGFDGSGIVDPINKANQPIANLGLGASGSDNVSPDDDEFDAYRKRMMLAYRFRPNPLNNPRRPYY